MGRGDHVYVRRGRRYSHHGVDCGDGTVIHYVGPRGTVRRVERTSMAVFAAGARVRVHAHKERLDADEAVRNAESRLGSLGYHLVRNNCEHFAAWCCTGEAVSGQVRRWMLAIQGSFAALVTTESLGPHVAVVGTAGAGCYALARRFGGR